MLKVAISGCLGRMGQRLCTLVDQDKKLKLVAGFEKPGTVFQGQSSLSSAPSVLFTDQAEEAIKKSDIIIDFTFPKVTLENLKLAKKMKKKMVIGSTGFTTKELASIKQAAKSIPIVFSPNMSVGVNLLFKLSEQVASVLDENYDIEIVEFHHRYKKDAPSGTAVKLLEHVSKARKKNLTRNTIYGRKGITGERKKGSIAVHTVRGGDVVGDHTVSFLGDGERVELVHKASSRDAFAKGALVAAKFLNKKTKGLFNMHDVLGI